MVHVQTKQHGVVLVAVAVTLAIVALIIFARIASQDTDRKLARHTGSMAILTKLDTALANYTAQNRRLPCPANGTLPSSTNVNAGIEQRNGTTGACIPVNQRNGVVPWVTLGLPESAALDAWNGRISYRVHPGLTARFRTTYVPPYNPMDMSNCRAPGTGIAAFSAQVNGAATTYLECNAAACAAAACTDLNNVLNNNGLPVTDGNANWLNQPSARTGAAYVLISHGPNVSGAYLASGVLSAGAGIVGVNEILNRNGVAILTGSVVAQSYRDAPYNITPTAQYFDDILSRPTIITVLRNANLGPRQ